MLAILADDLTGSLDSAAPFAARGMHVEVALGVSAIAQALDKNPQILSINLASREVGADAARRQIEAAVAAVPAGTRFFKKLDSRLKGHIAAELDAMPFKTALVIPAIPAFGRIVKNGCVTGFGVDRPISVAGRLGSHAARAKIPDISTHDEMVGSLMQAEADGIDLLVGARGLAEALAERMSGNAPSVAADVPVGPGVFVIGSRDDITLAQIDVLCRDETIRHLKAPDGRLDGVKADGSTLTLVQAVPGEGNVSSEQVSQALAESVCPSLTDGASTILFAGGATAEAILKKMGIAGFRLLGECLPGLGLAHAQGHCIIAKSGGFGQPDTLKEIAGRMRHKTG